METELRHRGVPQANGLAAASPKGDLLATDATPAPKGLIARKPKHGRAMQFLRGLTLFIYFFVSCVA